MQPLSWRDGAELVAMPHGRTLAIFLAAGVIVPSAAAAQVRQGVAPPLRSVDVIDALMMLDEQRLGVYLRTGWSAAAKLDAEGNTALHLLPRVCERNPTHDQAGMVRVARLLVRGGADPRAANRWNDTPLLIAQAPRYCGPRHPIVAYLRGAGG